MKTINFKNDIPTPILLANYEITTENSGSRLDELLGISSETELLRGILIKNNSSDNIKIIFESLGSGTDNYMILLGGESINLTNRKINLISLELIETIHEIIYIVQKDLTNKSCYYLLENYEQILVDEEILNTSNTEGPEYFYMTIKIGDETICQSGWDAKVYPPKVRYTVDIRPRLKNILRVLTDIFSTENLTHEYMGYSLD